MRAAWTFLIGAVLVLGVAGTAFAHVEVSPTEVPAGGSEEFTLEAAGEKEVPATEVRLEVPEGFRVTSVPETPGWQSGQEGNSIVWSGGRIDPDEVGEFVFEAEAPATAGETTWNGFVTYEDGSVVEWTGPPDSETPASVVEVVSGPSASDEPGGETAAHEDDHTAGAAAEGLPDSGGIQPAILLLLLLATVGGAASAILLAARARLHRG
ncbi:DUF1775 domain-containing protein (plasmid) [Rubrobacter marinus]|uniref:DUF1775 domain-containing protein n=1 Tax=Rubrobacter marinus TaxID=2653852 RepID=A0A6G8Q3I5_9ACTN|nr:DUF1775 domain-containing protein [Rubrobacter marinus]QIN81019.1 DUF1775 domain-containing protein [Rubrobacter marinus]